jgi:hypothetical protein
MPQHGFHAGRVSLERQDFHLALNRDTQCGKPLFKQTFRLRLWEHKSKGIGTLGALHTDAAYDLVACDDVNRIGLEPSINKRSRAATPVKQFEGTAPNNQSLGLVCPMGRLIDNPTIRTGTPNRASSEAIVIPTGPAPIIRMGTFIMVLQFRVI